MPMINKVAVCVLALGLGTLGGCLDLKPQPDVTRYFVLGETGPALSTASVDGPQGLALGMRALRVAPHLDTQRIVTRLGPHEVSFADDFRWGEGLDEGISRTLAAYLVATDPVRSVQVVPWPDRAAYAYVIEVHVERFEGFAPDAAHLLATWSILDAEDGRLLRQGRTDHRAQGWSASDYPDLVHKLDASLHVLAEDLAAGLRALETQR